LSLATDHWWNGITPNGIPKNYLRAGPYGP